MTAIFCSCALCGTSISDETDDEHIWMNEFRGVIAGRIGGAHLTGVGSYRYSVGEHLSASSHVHGRWDDPGHQHPNIAFGVMGQDPVDSYYGPPFHDACWSLLVEAFRPNPVPLRRLWYVCRSLPISRNTLTWGHDYGGLTAFSDAFRYPWEAPRELILEEDDEVVDVYNPFSGPDAQCLLDEEPEEPPSRTNTLPLTPASRDPFSRLPLELLVSIAEFLPTSDFLHCRLASEAFWPVFDSQSFWASRFAPDNEERNWLFEARSSADCSDWRSVFRATNDLGQYPGLANRLRIWKLIAIVMPVLNMEPGGCETLCDDFDDDESWWTEAISEMEPALAETDPPFPEPKFGDGSKAMWRSSLNIRPHQTFSLQFYFATLGNGVFLSGIEFVRDDGTENEVLGYKSESSLCHTFADSSADFRGFSLGIDSRGVQAVRVHFGEDGMSQWYGNPRWCPQTLKTVMPTRANAIRVSFDGFKLISISMAHECIEDMAYPPPPNLRNDGLWFPDFPPAQVCVNQVGFSQLDLHTRTYNPLFWAHFGGPGGIYLPQLTKIVAAVAYSAIPAIHFHYTDASRVVCELGRCSMAAREMTTRESSIDGPGGERITSVVPYYKYYVMSHNGPFCRFNYITSLIITTNFGRSLTFGADPSVPDFEDVGSDNLQVEEGTLITGFFASQDSEIGLTSLGVMSEVVEV